jgi:hypothetical protein
LKNDEFFNLFDRADKYGPDYTFAMYFPRYVYETLWKYKKNDLFYKRMKIFKENHKMILLNWKVDPYCLVHESLEKFVLEAHQHGHIQYHISKYTPLPSPKPPPPGPQVLTIYMLSAGFIVWLVTILAACLMFVFEHIYFYFKITTKIKKLKKKTKTVIQKVSKKFLTRIMETKKNPSIRPKKKKNGKTTKKRKIKKPFL